MERNRLPGFVADAALPGARLYARSPDHSAAAGEDIVHAAFRVTCGDPVLGAICTGLGGPAAFIPCFFNSGCMWFHAGLVNPACFSCTFE